MACQDAGAPIPSIFDDMRNEPIEEVIVETGPRGRLQSVRPAVWIQPRAAPALDGTTKLLMCLRLGED